jgi:hypothetical protein
VMPKMDALATKPEMTTRAMTFFVKDILFISEFLVTFFPGLGRIHLPQTHGLPWEMIFHFRNERESLHIKRHATAAFKYA